MLYFLIFSLPFADVLVGDATFMRRDINLYYYPVWKLVASVWNSGQIPFWNPYAHFGMPLAANVQSCVFYPPAQLLRLADFAWAFNTYILLHLALAGTTTFAWMRSWGASRAAAFLSGLAFGFSGFVMSCMNLTISLCALAWFPLVLLGFRQALRGDRRWELGTALLLLLQYLAGDPSIVYMTALVSGGAAVFLALRAAVEERRWEPRPVLAAARTFALLAGLSAFQTLLFADFMFSSSRMALRYSEAVRWSLLPNDLLCVAVPFVSDLTMHVLGYWARQSWLENLYAGASVLVLAAAALTARRDRRCGYLLVLGLFAVAVAIGRHSPLHQALYHGVPLFKYMRYPVRFFFPAAFAIACLAGFGLDAVLGGDHDKARARRWTAVALLFGLAALAIEAYFDRLDALAHEWAKVWLAGKAREAYPLELLQDLATSTVANLRRSALFAAIASVSIAAVLRWRVSRPLAAAFFIAVVAGDLSANPYEPRVHKSMMEEPSRHMREIFERGEKDLFRVFASPRTQDIALLGSIYQHLEQERNHFMSNHPSLFGLHDAITYDSLYVGRSVDLLARWGVAPSVENGRLLDLFNIRYVVSPNETLPGAYEPLGRAGHVTLFRNPDALPRAYLVPSAVARPLRVPRMKYLYSKEFDPEREAVVESLADAGGRKDGPGGYVEVVRYTPNAVTLVTKAAAESWLVFTDTMYPGWRATVDGKPAKALYVNHGFRGLRVPSGEHRIEWRFFPRWFGWGIAASLCTLLIGAYYCFLFPKNLINP